MVVCSFSRVARFAFLLFLSLGVAFTESATLGAQTENSRRAIPLITGNIDETHRVVLTGNVHPLAVARYDQGAASPSTPTGRMQLILRRGQTQQLALVQYLADLQPSFSQLSQMAYTVSVRRHLRDRRLRPAGR
jgi:hypothetical protein